MPLKTKRWNDPRRKRDGFRLLICRYRPRGVAKKDETWDTWRKDLAPSKELHAAYYGKHGQTPIGWREYRRRYLAEMQGEEPQKLIDELAELVAEGKTITLLCSSACTDPARCHRTLLQRLVKERIAQRQTSSAPAKPAPQ
jgi:uncharacterized protein YeaO (DUF488 family)